MIKNCVLFCLFMILLSACSAPSAPTPATTMTPEATSTPLPTAAFTLAPTYIPTATNISKPAFPTLATVPPPVPTLPGEQVFTDPEGWYSVAYPADWKKTGPAFFVGSDGFFETGYLPELGFIPRRLTVCEWLANIHTKKLYTIMWAGIHGCDLLPRPGNSPATTWEVIENPSADFSHRFLYIKTDNDHFARIVNTFTWLQPVDEAGKPDFQNAPLRPQDVAFWDNTSSLPPTISLKEYALPPEHQGEDPSKKIFLDYIPPEAKPTPSSPRGTYSSKTLESVNQSLAKFGYELRPQVDLSYLYDLYQNDERVIRNIFKLPDVYSFQVDHGEKLVFFAHTLIDPKLSPYEVNVISYLVQDHNILVWDEAGLNPMDPGWKPVWVEDKLLFLGVGDSVTLFVWNAQHEPVFSFATYSAADVPVKQFRSWKNHWILGVSDFVIQDGEILNEKYNFEEVFNWSSINDRPFYFFRKGPRSGFSYDGQFFSPYYHDIIHGYCCGLALNNPWMGDNAIRFFGKRDGVWYYVVLEIR